MPPVIAPIVQVNVEPAKLLDNAMLVALPLHMVVGLVVETSGDGFTVTTIFIGLPGHPLADGVTI